MHRAIRLIHIATDRGGFLDGREAVRSVWQWLETMEVARREDGPAADGSAVDVGAAAPSVEVGGDLSIVWGAVLAEACRNGDVLKAANAVCGGADPTVRVWCALCVILAKPRSPCLLHCMPSSLRGARCHLCCACVIFTSELDLCSQLKCQC